MSQHTEPDTNRHPYTVALTGGIASGKTLVSDEFARLGVPVVDTDVISRKLVEPRQPALKEIRRVFGPEIVDGDGRLRRTVLRKLIFSNIEARRKLENILHPMIKKQVINAIKELTYPYCILVIPLLTERASYPQVDRVLVVDVERETQIRRLMARDNCNRSQANQALAAQISRKQRLKIADDILKNSGTPALARIKVASLHEQYLRMSA